MQREGDKTDVVHPNVEGHAILARQLYTALDEALPKDASGR
jgi:lysophospholipase L1-like esterase